MTQTLRRRIRFWRVVGDWKAVFIGPIGPRPKMVDEITFTIRATPKGLVGAARAASWPGDLDVTDVILEGNRLAFTGTGRLGYSGGTGNGVTWARCCPKLMFDGTIKGNKMKLTMMWGIRMAQMCGSRCRWKPHE